MPNNFALLRNTFLASGGKALRFVQGQSLPTTTPSSRPVVHHAVLKLDAASTSDKQSLQVHATISWHDSQENKEESMTLADSRIFVVGMAHDELSSHVANTLAGALLGSGVKIDDAFYDTLKRYAEEFQVVIDTAHISSVSIPAEIEASNCAQLLGVLNRLRATHNDHADVPVQMGTGTV